MNWISSGGRARRYQPINGQKFPQQKPVRDYDAVELSFKKRLSNRWSGLATYTWSRLYGNYPGLASSDEAGGGTARLSPNVNRLYDGPWMMYDTHGQPVLGRLNTDRPHYLKLQGTYDLPWGTNVGINWYARSGALFSKYITYQGYSWVFYDGRGNLGRTPVEQAMDLLVQHDFRLGGTKKVNVSLNVANLFDNDVETSIYGRAVPQLVHPDADRIVLRRVRSGCRCGSEAHHSGGSAVRPEESVPGAARHPSRCQVQFLVN